MSRRYAITKVLARSRPKVARETGKYPVAYTIRPTVNSRNDVPPMSPPEKRCPSVATSSLSRSPVRLK
ncbi:hypothetical protein T12_3866 [Trichinella patagoniensis]|uniref:Uncharacterized protein n=1 Tax=Trichinella patagoniensis TaxID=990121 RepID=A0A0V0YG45_9BILA|nr:hypothetical protein T12_3866 [Trichinella patagoniensis]